MATELNPERSRAERRRLKRESRREGRQKSVRKSRRRQWIERITAAVIVVLLAGAGGYRFYGWWTSEAPGEFVPSLGNAHIPNLNFVHAPYNSDPPTSGPHLSSVARWGVHRRPVPKELQVHNLEDGGVVVQYNCAKAKDCNSVQRQLERIIRDYDQVVLAPYPTMDSLIALTAWTRIKKLDRVDERKIRGFIEAYIDIDHHPTRRF